MPTYEYLCDVHGEFEEIHSITIKLEHCPKCAEEGKVQPVKRLISLGARGVVELSGQDLVDHVKSDAKRIQKEASKDANKYASLLGEDRYHQMQTQLDRRKR